MTITAPEPNTFEPIELDVSHIITEDDTPVDNPFSEKQMRLLTEPLYSNWNPGVPFVAMANVGLFFALNSPPLVPDTLVALDVAQPDDLLPKENRAYFTWLYGKVPDIVVEIVSNRAGDELTRKMKSYAHMGVPYYVVYDPEGHIQTPALQCFWLDPAVQSTRRIYRRMSDACLAGASLGLVEWKGLYEGKDAPWIRWVDEKGLMIPTGAEQAAKERLRADAERRIASEERRIADEERNHAENERRKSELLAAKLRELGFDPSSLLAS